MMKRGAAWLVITLLLGALALAGPAAAGPKGKHHHKKNHGHSAGASGHHQPSGHGHVDLYLGHGGPPPWAPAHGYRRKHGATTGVYVAPFGIGLGGCQRGAIGAALGGAAGGLIASEIASGHDRVAAIIGGSLLGVLVGGTIGHSMDQLDQRCIGQILEHAPSTEVVTWQNPDSGAAFEVTPTRTYQDDGGRYCREYQTTVTIQGAPQEAYGTACRQPDGSWQRVS